MAKEKVFKDRLTILSAGLIIFSSITSFAGPKWKKVNSTSGSGLQGGYTEFAQDGTWTVPAGVTKIFVTVIGGGGGGGSGASYLSGGGGGGGSCIKRSTTALISANGGVGGKFDGSVLSTPGSRANDFVTVTPGETLNIYVGGGGGAAGYAGGGGGYGPCGVGGAGGAGSGGAGGTGGANLGGGGGGGNNPGGNAASTTGGTGDDYGYSGGIGGTSTAGGAPGGSNSAGGGGGSGGAGGAGGGASSASRGSFATGRVLFTTNSTVINYLMPAGERGTNYESYAPEALGGGPGAVYIEW